MFMAFPSILTTISHQTIWKWKLPFVYNIKENKNPKLSEYYVVPFNSKHVFKKSLTSFYFVRNSNISILLYQIPLKKKSGCFVTQPLFAMYKPDPLKEL